MDVIYLQQAQVHIILVVLFLLNLSNAVHMIIYATQASSLIVPHFKKGNSINS